MLGALPEAERAPNTHYHLKMNTNYNNYDNIETNIKLNGTFTLKYGQKVKIVVTLWELLFKKRCTMVNNKLFLKKRSSQRSGSCSHFLEAFFYTIVVCLALITIILSVVLREAAQV